MFSDTSIAQAALAQYRQSRSKNPVYAAHRSSDRDIYEPQLKRMADQEENGRANDRMVAGLFLLIVLSIQSEPVKESGISGFFSQLWRSGLASMLDSGYENDETGSHLERVLGAVEFSLPKKPGAVESESVALSVLAHSCTTSFSREDLVAFSSASMQDAFLSMHDKTIMINGNAAAFFTLSQKELVYQKSWLCAMSDIRARAKAGNIFPASYQGRGVVQNLLQIVTNTVVHLSDLTTHLVGIFPELSVEQHALLRTKAVCFLALNWIFRMLESKAHESTEFLPAKNFFEVMLKEFFNPKRFSSEFREEAFCLSSKFFGFLSGILFENVSPEVSEHFYLLQKPTASFVDWMQQSNFQITLRDQYLLENFLQHSALEMTVFC